MVAHAVSLHNLVQWSHQLYPVHVCVCVCVHNYTIYIGKCSNLKNYIDKSLVGYQTKCVS